MEKEFDYNFKNYNIYKQVSLFVYIKFHTMGEPQNATPKSTHFFSLFTIVYFCLYIFPFPLESVPFVGSIFKYYTKAFDWLVVWTGKNIFGLEHIEKIKMTGSGDTTFDFFRLFTLIVLAVFVTGLLFKSKIDKQKIIVFGRTYARYFLAFMLLSYGFSKFFEGQFPYPSLERLDQKIGDSSPMGLLWTFMGYSKSYAAFGGLCQVSAGFLLFFRRTSVIGSLMALAVMTNVVVVNFSYDGPVNLFATDLVLMALLILAHNLKNLFGLLFQHKNSKLVSEQSLIKKKNLKYVVLSLKFIAIAGCVLLFLMIQIRSFINKPSNHLQAIYYPKKSLAAKDISWEKLIIGNRYVTVFYDTKNYEDFDTEIDTTQQIIQLKSQSDTLIVHTLKYRFSDDDKTMYLSGLFKTDSISAQFDAKRKEDFELVKRSFNWINEYPYNR